MSSLAHFSGGMVHPHPPSLAGKYWALSCIGQVATWDKSQHPLKSPTLGSHVLGQASQIKGTGKRIFQSPPAAIKIIIKGKPLLLYYY